MSGPKLFRQDEIERLRAREVVIKHRRRFQRELERTLKSVRSESLHFDERGGLITRLINGRPLEEHGDVNGFTRSNLNSKMHRARRIEIVLGEIDKLIHRLTYDRAVSAPDPGEL